MKRFFHLLIAVLMILAVPFAAHAAAPEEEIVEPCSLYNYSSQIVKANSTTAMIYATSAYDSTIELVATAQLQQYRDDKWVNFGSSITSTKLATTLTTSKPVVVISGYKYRVKGSHRIGVKTFTTYSGVLSF